ncbi:hypothetical protein [uncultured Caulobacter sp.]|uniref:hypothetical protein n=1 Tax=uncultured Caulobacter sp. TaxID=158749 RepID=UPI00262B31EC|nr:hypothetical protein [uncultured Caulobacter sp.]
MTRRVRPRRHSADRSLATTFRRNASGFHQAAETALPRYPELTRYFLAIAIELSLKAYLLQRGITDDWCRVHLRHDLVKALRSARRAGLSNVPTALPELAALLSPYYRVHAMSHMAPDAIASVCWSQACVTVRALVDAIGDAAGARWPEPRGAV